MKFKGEGNTTVWDAQRDRALCQFEKGILETDDPRTCKKLIELGYEYEGEAPLQAWLDGTEGEITGEVNSSVGAGDIVTPPIDEEFEALKVRAKELKVKNWHTMKKDNLVEAVAAAEKGAEV